MKIIVAVGAKMTNSIKKIISIIIRTKNEEKWIGHCLEAIFLQKVNASFEVIIVDNNSDDHTLAIANRFPVKCISINKFLPGKAINEGVRASKGNYLVILSAHCIPKKDNWLQNMINNFIENKNVAGVYGRQLPLSYTDPIDKRDLLIVFGLDKRVQEKDYFFHNANSMIPKSIWNKFPFDEKVTNIEDRLWGKLVINAGYNIIYEPEAAVYHHHGLHQGNSPERAKSVVSVLENIDVEQISDIPETMFPEKINVVALIPIMGNLNDKKSKELFNKTVLDLNDSKYINTIYCLCDDKSLIQDMDVKWLNRKTINNADKLSLNKILKESLKIIEKKLDFPDSILYVNHEYIDRPIGIFDELIIDAQFKGFDTIFPGLMDYGHYWYSADNDTYQQTEPSLRSREQRKPQYKALYGLGWLSSAWVIRNKKLFDCKIGIMELKNQKYSRRFREK
tara:strand:+ start:1130 stop:2479 length:1350 start_codon:yes stop_codon:yes gene_type:complete